MKWWGEGCLGKKVRIVGQNVWRIRSENTTSMRFCLQFGRHLSSSLRPASTLTLLAVLGWTGSLRPTFCWSSPVLITPAVGQGWIILAASFATISTVLHALGFGRLGIGFYSLRDKLGGRSWRQREKPLKFFSKIPKKNLRPKETYCQ